VHGAGYPYELPPVSKGRSAGCLQEFRRRVGLGKGRRTRERSRTAQGAVRDQGFRHKPERSSVTYPTVAEFWHGQLSLPRWRVRSPVSGHGSPRIGFSQAPRLSIRLRAAWAEETYHI